MKHGKFSGVYGRFQKAYDASKRLEDLLDLERPVALLDACTTRAAVLCGDGDTPDFRKRALELYEKAVSLGAEDPAAASAALNELGDLLRAGGKEWAGLSRLEDSAEKLARWVTSTQQIRLSQKQAINATDLVAILRRIADIVLAEADGAVAGKILRRFEGEVVGRPILGAPEAEESRN